MKLKSEIQFLIQKAGVDTHFSKKSTHFAEQFSENPSQRDQQQRRNIKKLALCTIDGETAKDFDDAVYGFQIGEDYGVLIAIADVSYYVPERSPVDVEAQKRRENVQEHSN